MFLKFQEANLLLITCKIWNEYESAPS